MDYPAYAKELVRLYGPKNAGLVVDKLWEVTEDPATITKAAVEAGCAEADVKKAIGERAATSKAEVLDLKKEIGDRLARGELTAAEAMDLLKKVAEIEEGLAKSAPSVVPGAPELAPEFKTDLKSAAAKYTRLTVGDGAAKWTGELRPDGSASFSGEGWTLEIDAAGKVTASTGAPPMDAIGKSLKAAAEVKNRLELRSGHGIVAETRPAAPVAPGTTPPLVINEAWSGRMRFLTSLDASKPVDLDIMRAELAKAKADKLLTEEEVKEIDTKHTQIEEAAKANRITAIEAKAMRAKVRDAAVERGRLLREVKEIKVR
jgi:hypothetical protein